MAIKDMTEAQVTLRLHFEYEAGPGKLDKFEVLSGVEHPDKGAWEFKVRVRNYLATYARIIKVWVRAIDGKVDMVEEVGRVPTDYMGNPGNPT